MARFLTGIGLLSYAATTAAVGLCPPIGPVFPAPDQYASSETFKAAMSNLTSILDEAFRTGNSTRGPILDKDTYSIQIFTTGEENKIYEYHHEGDFLIDTVGEINGDSIYLIGSISKLWTVYMLLQVGGYEVFTDRVTKYLPELEGIEHWDETTVGALAGQVGGVVGDLISWDDSIPQSRLENVFPGAFPDLSPEERSPCSGNVTHCTREQFLEALQSRRKTNLPNAAPTYSNAAFVMLGYVIETISGKTYAEVLEERVIEPLGLTHTTASMPDDPTGGVILHNETFASWNLDISEATAMGGIFSSPNDLSEVGRSILQSKLLPVNVTRAWLKPTSFTSSLIGGVGRPWEIFRASVDPKNNRVVDMYTKGGFLGLHHTNLVLIPEFNVGFVAMVASEEYSQDLPASALIADVLIPALEDVAREQAESRFAGTYTATNGLNSSMVLSTTPGVPGLSIDSWFSNSTDILPIVGVPGQIQAYPTTIESEDGKEVSWRIGKVIDFGMGEDGPFSACPSWIAMGRPSYGIYELDELVFHLDEDGNAKGVEPKPFKIVLAKEE